jgi:hypothetical protein
MTGGGELVAIRAARLVDVVAGAYVTVPVAAGQSPA